MNVTDPSESNYIVVVAIDFGTTYSGYAFAFIPRGEAEKSAARNPDHFTYDVKMNKNWGSQANFSSYKTPTCVLTDASGELHSFGYDAEYNFCTNCEDGFQLYRNFKMLLREEQHITKYTHIKSTTGHSRRAIDIFAMALKYLKKHFLDTIKSTNISTLHENNVKWVLTVPAIWKDSAKHFMRQVAYLAGLIPEFNSQQLLIALEPEAASMYCRSDEIQHQYFNGENDETMFTTGAKYLIIDAGGGTIDIVAHEVLESGHVKEIHPPSGGPWGGICADKAFESLLEEIFGSSFIKIYKAEKPRDWLMLLLKFEKSKGYITEHSKCNIEIPHSFFKVFNKQRQGFDVEDAILEKKHLGIDFQDGILVINSETVKDFFKVTEDIRHHLESLLDKYGHDLFDFVVLVGGFAQCCFLQSTVKEAFANNKAAVIFPLEPMLAVVKGAVMFGSNPFFIEMRIATYSYGYSIMRRFIEGEDDEKYACNYRELKYCTDLFKPMINIGEEVDINTRIEHQTGSEDIVSTMVEFYAADRLNVKYTNEDGVTKKGVLTIHFKEQVFSRKQITIETTFGGTELLVKARDCESGELYYTTLNFLN